MRAYNGRVASFSQIGQVQASGKSIGQETVPVSSALRVHRRLIGQWENNDDDDTLFCRNQAEKTTKQTKGNNSE